MTKLNYLMLLFLLLLYNSCDRNSIDKKIENPYEDVDEYLTVIQPQTQRNGDSEKGKDYLLNGDYIDSGIPYDIYQTVFGGTTFPNELERTGKNANLQFGFTAITNDDDFSMVVPNCMQCHAGYVDNKFYVGLGNTAADYTTDPSNQTALLDNFVIAAYGASSNEFKAYEPFSRATKATGPHLVTETVGSNPADKLALVLAAYRNPDDLVWQNEPSFEIPVETPPADVPAWWLLKKKNAMFTTGLGKGDFAKHMMTASILTLKDTVKANEVDTKFADVLSYLYSLEAPEYSGNINNELADKGRVLFDELCSKCHGTYGEVETYPNLLVKQSLLETDPAIANGTQLYTDFVGWFNNSWFSSGDYPSEYDQVDGYVAPPLDGIWATAPYLHNGSVPTLKDLLDSKLRPDLWKRVDGNNNYDHEKMGLSYTTPAAKTDKFTFDASLPGYSAKGHYFSDHLTQEERTQLLEYLKTL